MIYALDISGHGCRCYNQLLAMCVTPAYRTAANSSQLRRYIFVSSLAVAVAAGLWTSLHFLVYLYLCAIVLNIIIIDNYVPGSSGVCGQCVLIYKKHFFK